VSGFTSTFDNISFQATFAGAQAEIPTPWSANEVADVRFVTETGRDRTIFVHPGHHPWFLFFGGTAGNWTFGDVVFTSLPLAWGDTGSANVPVGWSWQGQTATLAAPNWPATVDMSDGRVYYAGEPAQKNRILGSRSGSADDFTIGSNPGDALDFKLATKGAIRWLRSHRVLLAGTDLGQHSISGSKGTPLVGDIQARTGIRLPFRERGRSRRDEGALRLQRSPSHSSGSFDFQTGGFESKDVTFAAEHITADLIKELHHAWTPDAHDHHACSSPASSPSAPSSLRRASDGVLDGGCRRNDLHRRRVSKDRSGRTSGWRSDAAGSVYLEKLNLSESTELLELSRCLDRRELGRERQSCRTRSPDWRRRFAQWRTEPCRGLPRGRRASSS
jgi:hypothetical protein